MAANLAGAMNHLVSQALDHDFPAAPAFEAETKSSNLKKVFEVVSEAAPATSGALPRTALPSMKVTVPPVGAAVLGGEAVTAATRVTG